MNKTEALQALKDGKKITHRYFTTDEYLVMKDDMIVDEDGYQMVSAFWDSRKNPNWDKDWKIYKER